MELTEEDFAETDEQVALLEAIHEAGRRGDRAAETLMAVKEGEGADWIREMGYDTRLADEKYGERWLDE